METYHALTPIASPQPPSEDPAPHAIAPLDATTPEPEPSAPDEQPAAVVNQTLEELAREGARRMLERALAVEVDEFLGRPRYERRLEHSWRPLNGGLTIMTLLLGSARFVDGVYVPQPAQVSAA